MFFYFGVEWLVHGSSLGDGPHPGLFAGFDDQIL